MTTAALMQFTAGKPLAEFVAESEARAFQLLNDAARAIAAAFEEKITPQTPAQFLTPLRVEKIGRKKWRYVAPFVYYCAILRRVIFIPAGRETDFASVPRWAPVLYSVFGDTSHEEAGVHDELYGSGLVPRDKADAVFREAFGAPRSNGAPGYEPWWRRRYMWKGVRLGGWAFYKDAAPSSPPIEPDPYQSLKGE